MAEKKQWAKPQLVILGRGTEEEKVLLACKYRQSTALEPTQSGQSRCNQGNLNCFTNARS